MKKTIIYFIAMAFAITSCRRENMPPADNCNITQVSNEGTAIVNLSHDARNRVTQVQYITDSEFSYNISYTGNQKITETPVASPVYEKKIYTYNAAGNILDIKSYFEHGNPVIDEQLIFTYSGNEIATDTMYINGVVSQVKEYTWLNGNLVKLVIDGSRIIHRGYDLTKTPAQGDAAWVFNHLENVGYYPPTANLMIYEYEEGSGNPVSGSLNYSFDDSGKITGLRTDYFDFLSFSWQCN